MVEEKSIRLLVADDHPIFRAGVVSMLAAESDMLVIAQAQDGREVVEAYRMHQPDVVILDLNMPGLDGISAISQLRLDWPGAKIVVLTNSGGDAVAVRAIRAGAQAYLVKTTIRAELLVAIRAVAAGDRYLPESLAVDIAFHTADKELTAREVEVLSHVATFGSNKRVASEMGLSDGTVKVHMKSVLSKLGAADRTQAVSIAIKRGIIEG